eukprot:1192924-Prorocentrum_minimum.AAC.2
MKDPFRRIKPANPLRCRVPAPPNYQRPTKLSQTRAGAQTCFRTRKPLKLLVQVASIPAHIAWDDLYFKTSGSVHRWGTELLQESLGIRSN